MKTDTIVSAGLPRAGTTRCFNLIRGVLQAAGIDSRSSFWDGRGFVPLESSGNLQVLKCHLLANGLEGVHERSTRDSLLVVSVRRSRETALSMVRAMNYSLEDAVKSSEAFVEHYERYVKYFGRILVLDNAAELDSCLAATELANALGIELSHSESTDLTRRLGLQATRGELAQLTKSNDWKGKFEEYDPESQLHANHIGADPTYSGLDLTSRFEAQLNELDERNRTIYCNRAIDMATGLVVLSSRKHEGSTTHARSLL